MQAQASNSHRAIAEYLLRNPARLPTWGIEELASRVNVSAATLSRFARALGFESYSGMRCAAADVFQSMLQPVEKLRNSIELEASQRASGGVAAPAGMPGATGQWAKSIESSLNNTRQAAAGLDAPTTEKLVALLSNTNAVYTMGFGLSAHLSALLALHLQPFCKRCINVVEYGGTEVAAGRLMDIEKGDVLVVISFPRYAADALRLSNYARSRGAVIVAITDSPASPFASQAQHTLLAPASHPVLSSSLTAAVVLIEALAAALMVSNRNNVKQAAKLTDAISTFLVMSADDLRSLGGR
jgi:DNA-binding MurR/RpiR family transcriptional regulator